MKFVSSIVFLFLILSCTSGKLAAPDKPNNLIDKNMMVNVLYDMAVINGAKSSNGKLLSTKGLAPQAYIFNKYNIDSAQFVLSNAYYTYHTADYKHIYDNLQKRLDLDKKHYQNVVDSLKLDKKAKDSLKRVKASKIKTLKLNEKTLKKG